MRPSIITLIIVILVGSIVIFTGFVFNEKETIVNEEYSSYEKLLNYKNELENINKYNLEILYDLENKLKNPNIEIGRAHV